LGGLQYAFVSFICWCESWTRRWGRSAEGARRPGFLPRQEVAGWV